MSHMVMNQIQKHIDVLTKKAKGDDLKELGKLLSAAKAYEAVTTDGRSKKRLAKDIATINERIKNAAPDTELTTILKKLEEVVGLMSSHPNYKKRTRKTSKTKKK